MKNMRLALFVLVLALLAVPAYAENSYRIYGTVTYQGIPLPGDTIIATNLQTQQTNRTQTLNDGTYSMAIRASEGNTIKIDTYNATIMAKAGKSDIKIDIKLPKQSDIISVSGITGMAVNDNGSPVSRKGLLVAGTMLFAIVTAVVLIKLNKFSAIERKASKKIKK